jgi:hypothetical protein
MLHKLKLLSFNLLIGFLLFVLGIIKKILNLLYPDSRIVLY